jgi:hypothetical protein
MYVHTASTVGGWRHAEIRKQRQKSVKETHIAERRELKNCVPLVLGKRKRENNKAEVKLHYG